MAFSATNIEVNCTVLFITYAINMQTGLLLFWVSVQQVQTTVTCPSMLHSMEHWQQATWYLSCYLRGLLMGLCRNRWRECFFGLVGYAYYLPKFTILASMFVCRFVCLSVCLSVSLSVLSSITHERFDISSPNLVHIWNGWAVPVCDIDK